MVAFLTMVTNSAVTAEIIPMVALKPLFSQGVTGWFHGSYHQFDGEKMGGNPLKRVETH